MISYDDFIKTELKVATVRAAERVQGSEKLLKLRVALGDQERQIIAGIGTTYQPENLVGKQIVIVANLEPRMLMGLESRGMLLAASGSTGPVLLIPEGDVEAGAIIQ